MTTRKNSSTGKKIALAEKNENEWKELTDLAPLRVFFGS